MAEPLKNMYNPVFFERILPVMGNHLPSFEERRFVYRVFDNQWPDLELKARVKKIANSLKEVLPGDFPSAAMSLVNLSRAFRNERICVQGFELIFIPEYIGMFGAAHPKESLRALREVTRLVSGEFAIRTFLNEDPESTMSQLAVWATDPDPNVRRLASEGCRPRLPWAIGVPWLKTNPHRILPLLERLKADPSPYVRRSVANNLNDIAKDHPELVLEVVGRWKGTDPVTDEIVRHGCRTLFKKGDAKSLLLHGISPDAKVHISGFRLSQRRVRVGDELNFTLALKNSERKPARLRLDYAIDFLTSKGRQSTKVFRLSEKVFAGGNESTLTWKHSFRNLTTRKHYEGRHTIHIIVNGVRKVSRDFFVG